MDTRKKPILNLKMQGALEEVMSSRDCHFWYAQLQCEWTSLWGRPWAAVCCYLIGGHCDCAVCRRGVRYSGGGRPSIRNHQLQPSTRRLPACTTYNHLQSVSRRAHLLRAGRSNTQQTSTASHRVRVASLPLFPRLPAGKASTARAWARN
jgi:hypothetical protein